MENITVACPIVYGSIAFYLGKKAPPNTHKWILFVRGPNDEDLSIFVEKVAFTLHPSFQNQVRVVTEPPYEITETGWGEFEASIRIYFKSFANEQPIDLFHHIRLYPPMAQQQLNLKKPVVSENYDEIIFYSPKPAFYHLLMMYGNQTNIFTPSINNQGITEEKNPSSSSSTAVPMDEEDVEQEGQEAEKIAANKEAQASSSSSYFKKFTTAFPEYYSLFDDNLDTELLLSIKEHLGKEINDAKNKLVNLESDLIETMNKKQQQDLLNAASVSSATANPTATTSNAVPANPNVQSNLTDGSGNVGENFGINIEKK